MFRLAAVAATVILGTCCPASAQSPPDGAPAFDGCFARTYDAAHLAAHAGQTVSAVKLKLKPRAMDDGFNISAELRFGFREDKRAFYAVGICKDAGESLYCALDQDAGEITIKPADGGMQVSPINDLRVDAGDEAENFTIKKTNAEDRVFLLHAVAASDCKEFDTEE